MISLTQSCRACIKYPDLSAVLSSQLSSSLEFFYEPHCTLNRCLICLLLKEVGAAIGVFLCGYCAHLWHEFVVFGMDAVNTFQ